MSDARQQSALPVIEQDDDQPGDELALLNTGRVRMKFVTYDDHGAPRRDAHVVTLRRPTVGEYRAIREWLSEESETGRQRMREIAEARARETAPADGETDEQFEERVNIALSRLNHDDYDPTVELERWLRRVVDKLGDGTLPDDPPFWVTALDLPARLISHWRNVPLAHGSRSNRSG